MRRNISCYIMASFYFFAGLNHFIRPDGYIKMIPDYFKFHTLINYLSGFAEILLGIMVAISVSRRFACKAIILMLVLFLPVHIYMLQTGWCLNGKCFPFWLIWVRLLILQPLLIYWAWWNMQRQKKSTLT